jgi:hypothetical protein
MRYIIHVTWPDGSRETLDDTRDFDAERSAVGWARSVAGAGPRDHFPIDASAIHCKTLLAMLERARAVPPSRQDVQLAEIREFGT